MVVGGTAEYLSLHPCMLHQRPRICREAAYGAADVCINLKDLFDAMWDHQRRRQPSFYSQDHTLCRLDPNGCRTKLHVE